MAENRGPTNLPRRDAVVERVDEMVRSDATPAVFAVEASTVLDEGFSSPPAAPAASPAPPAAPAPGSAPL